MPGRPGYGRKSLHTLQQGRAGDKEAIALVKVLEKCQAALDQAKPVRSSTSRKEALAIPEAVVPDHRQTGHVRRQRGRGRLREQPLLDRLREYAVAAGQPVVAICAKTEAELADMEDEDRALFLAEMGQDGRA